jgi:hypothetical protein
MKIVVTVALVLMSASPALAASHYNTMYHDNIRPNGHPRPQAVYDAALNDRYSQTGLSRDAADTQAFKDCIMAHNYSWVYTKPVQDAPSKRVANAAIPMGIPKGHFIDPDTGLICQNTGFASICESPPADMTIRYTSKHGFNCTRTGAMSVCSNL